jgi:tetratricopeptide (TPR) repeat protein
MTVSPIEPGDSRDLKRSELTDITSLAVLHLKHSAYDSAEPLLLRLLELKRSKGEDHPEVATVLASLGTVRRALGMHESAEQLWRRVLDIRERTLAPNHFAIATALEQLGDSCAARGKIGEALGLFERALAIRELTLGSEHPSVSAARERIADMELQASEESIAALLNTTQETSPERLDPQPALIVPHPSENSALEEEGASGSDESAMARASNLKMSPMPYIVALETVREELERSPEKASLTERTKAALAGGVAFVAARKTPASIAVVMALLLIAVAITARHTMGAEQNAGTATVIGSALPRIASLAAAKATAPANHSGKVAVSSASPVPIMTSAGTAHPRAVEEHGSFRNPPQKQKKDNGIAIPGVSSSVMSGLESLAVNASRGAARSSEPLMIQPAAEALPTRPTSFLEADQLVQPQRARLIGAEPQPVVPRELAGRNGDVTVQFNVDTEGRPVMSSLTVLKTSSPMLTEAVKNVIPEMRFEPARTGGLHSQPAVDVVVVPFRFTYQNEQHR